MPGPKTNEKKLAIAMRKQGMLYKEISKRLNVSKGTLSVWLKDIPIPEEAKEKRNKYIKKGVKEAAETWSLRNRKRRRKMVEAESEKFSSISLTNNALALVGTSLYWAEGTKRNKFSFSNTDVDMIKLYIRWLTEILQVSRSRLVATVNVYLTDNKTYDEVQRYWETQLGLNPSQFRKPAINSVPKNSKLKHIGKHPYGVLSLAVSSPQKVRAAYTALVVKLGKDTKFVEWGSNNAPSVTYNLHENETK